MCGELWAGEQSTGKRKCWPGLAGWGRIRKNLVEGSEPPPGEFAVAEWGGLGCGERTPGGEACRWEGRRLCSASVRLSGSLGNCNWHFLFSLKCVQPRGAPGRGGMATQGPRAAGRECADTCPRGLPSRKGPGCPAGKPGSVTPGWPAAGPRTTRVAGACVQCDGPLGRRPLFPPRAAAPPRGRMPCPAEPLEGIKTFVLELEAFLALRGKASVPPPPPPCPPSAPSPVGRGYTCLGPSLQGQRRRHQGPWVEQRETLLSEPSAALPLTSRIRATLPCEIAPSHREGGRPAPVQVVERRSHSSPA